MVDVSRNVVAALLVLVVLVSGFGTVQWLQHDGTPFSAPQEPNGNAAVSLVIPPPAQGDVYLTIEGNHG